MLLVVTRPDAEVLVLEFLPRLGYASGDADAVLAMIAELNAVSGVPDGVFDPAPGMPAEAFELGVRAALDTLAEDASLAGLVEPATWLGAYRHACLVVAAMPRGLNHGELAPQQVGWIDRRGRSEPVFLDLETMALLPLFTDVATVLGGLAEGDEVAERELFDTYLRHLDRRRPRADTPRNAEAAWEDLLHVRVVTSVESLPWLVSMRDHPDLVGAASATARLLGDDLRTLRLI